MEKCHLVEIRCRNSYVGYTVVPDSFDRTSTETKKEIARQALRSMGFNDTDEYIGALPGWCHTDSEHTFKAYWNCQLSNGYSTEDVLFTVFLEMYHIDYPPFGDGVENYLTNRYEESVKERCGEMFALPLIISKMKQTYGFKNVPKKRLWFCDDWK